MREDDVIVKNHNGIEINYGPVKKTRLDSGLEFVGDEWRLDQLLLADVPVRPYKSVKSGDEFYHPLTIDVYLATLLNPMSFWACSQDQVLAVAKELSKVGTVRISAHARILAVLKDGEVVSRHYLDEFYDGLSNDDLERVSF